MCVKGVVPPHKTTGILNRGLVYVSLSHTRQSEHQLQMLNATIRNKGVPMFTLGPLVMGEVG